MESSLLECLLRMALGTSVAILLVLSARTQVRGKFGARTAYHLWLLVPALMIAAALPPIHVSRVIVVDAIPALSAGRLGAPVVQAAQMTWTTLVAFAWLAGALATAGVFGLAQRRYLRSLGSLSAQAGVFLSATTAQGPALLGIWRARIVLPADFEQRYSSDEQQLIIAHEQCHAARRDPIVNALLALLQCALWFNPLVHLAAARCRFDQELACDADVLRDHPGRARAYAAAMLKTQVASAFAPVACHWQSSHPLKERIMQLNQISNNPARRMAGRALLAVFIATGIVGTMAARATPMPGAGAHTGQFRLGESEHVAITDDDGSGKMLMVMDGRVKLAPVAVSQQPSVFSARPFSRAMPPSIEHQEMRKANSNCREHFSRATLAPRNIAISVVVSLDLTMFPQDKYAHVQIMLWQSFQVYGPAAFVCRRSRNVRRRAC